VSLNLAQIANEAGSDKGGVNDYAPRMAVLQRKG
jgi:hypothetical protein